MIEHRSADWSGVHEQTPPLLEIRAKLSGIFAWLHGEGTVELFCQAQAIRQRQGADGFENLPSGHGFHLYHAGRASSAAPNSAGERNSLSDPSG